MTKNIKNNDGISLVIALVFLFVSTLIGVTALRTSILNEKMSLNSLQREQALEAAEAALLAGEELVEDMSDQIIAAVVTTTGPTLREVTAAAQTCTAFGGGVCVPVEIFEPDNFDNWIDVNETQSINAWSTNGRHRILNDSITTQYDLNTSPRYIIEFMGYVRNSGTSGESQCTSGSSIAWQLNAWPYCNLDPAQFRITALATSGNSDQTRVMLQTTYVVN